MSHLSLMKPEPTLQQSPFMTSSDVVELLAAHGVRISSACLQKWRANGTGPSFIRLTDTPRSRVLYPAATVSDWLEQRLGAATGSAHEAAHV